MTQRFETFVICQLFGWTEKKTFRQTDAFLKYPIRNPGNCAKERLSEHLLPPGAANFARPSSPGMPHWRKVDRRPEVHQKAVVERRSGRRLCVTSLRPGARPLGAVFDSDALSTDDSKQEEERSHVDLEISRSKTKKIMKQSNWKFSLSSIVF